MKDNKLTITIDQPVESVFAFTLNPHNTPLWIEDIYEEVTNEWPPKIGTKYRNRSMGNERWLHYVITEIDENKTFSLQDLEGNYSVQYTFRPVGDNTTEFEYHEWTKNTELDNPFDTKQLSKLKEILEKLN